MERIRVLIADDHPIFRQGIRGVLESEPDIEVVGEAADGKQAVALARSVAPDIILMDIHLPSINGIEAARSIKLHLPRCGVILLTAFDDEEQLFQAIRVAASAYFLKDIRPDELMDGIRRAHAGEYLINESVLTRPLVASRVLKQFRELSSVTKEMEPLFVPLSAREIEVLDYIARGNSNKEIARALKISDQTVKNHITSILRKLAVNDRTQAVVYALRRGWIKMQELSEVAVEQALQETIAELRALAAEVRLDLSSQEAELKELVIIIKQTQSEITRLAPRKNDTAKRLRDMEKNVEHFSRDDILAISEEASEAQMRTFAMESQLEQLEYKLKTAERARRNLLRFSALVEQLPEMEAPPQAADVDEGHTTKEVIARVVRAEEDERQRNAVAIHDGATQELTNLVLRAQLCQRLLENEPERGRQEFQELQAALVVALQESRRLIHDLRPLAIDDLGVFVSLRRYVQALTDRGDSARVELRINGPESRFEAWRELAIFRIAQEALSNAVRHARAKSILVSVDTSAQSFRGVIEDDGVGFNAPTGANAARTRRQLGLAEVYERVTLVEGTISIESRMGRGTRVRFEVPLT